MLYNHKLHDEFIQQILDTRGRFSIPADEIKQCHHIIPECMGGISTEDNLIDLYPREHFIAHRLLAEENPTNKSLVWAYWNMCTLNNSHTEITPEEYEQAYIFFIKNVACMPKSEETKQKMRKPKSEEHKKHISEGQKGLKKGPAWNKGLTKDTDDRVKFNAEQTSKAMKEKHLIPWNKGLTKETDDRVRQYSISSKKSHTGYKWDRERQLRGLPKLRKSVKCIETGIIYSSVTEAFSLTGVHNIGIVCEGKRNTAGGFHWEWYSEDKDD